jgi:hypothetical protein
MYEVVLQDQGFAVIDTRTGKMVAGFFRARYKAELAAAALR